MFGHGLFPIGEYLILFLGEFIDKHPLEDDTILYWRIHQQKVWENTKQEKSGDFVLTAVHRHVYVREQW